MKQVKSAFSLLCVFLGCLFGSGFVGGRELLLVFGRGSVFSVVIFVIFLCVIVFFAICFAKRHNINGLDSFSTIVFGKFHFLAQLSLLLCYFVVTATLLAATDDCVQQIFHIDTNLPVFSYLSAVFAWIIMHKDTKTLQKFNSYTVPFILLYLLVVYFLNADKIDVDISEVDLVSAISYALFSFVMMLGILTTLHPRQMSKKALLPLILIFGAVLFVFCFLQISLLKNPLFGIFKIPLLATVSDKPVLYVVAGIVIIFAILTSLLSNTLPIIEFASHFVGDRHLSSAIVLFLALLLSLFGFDFIVEYCYPVASIIGILTIFAMVAVWAKKDGNVGI